MAHQTANENSLNKLKQSKIISALNAFVHDENSAVVLHIELDDFSFKIDINGNHKFAAASVLKLPLAMTIERKSQLGDIDLRQVHDLSQIMLLAPTNSALRSLVHTRGLSIEELLRFMLISSDELATRYLRTLISTEEVNEFLTQSGFTETKLSTEIQSVSVAGTTTANEAIKLISFASDENCYPICASALSSTIFNSRIPLGAMEFEVNLLHKTGSLPGVAHDVAELATTRGLIRIAFLTKNQADTVLTSYRMGMCTREILAACGVAARTTRSVIQDSYV